MTVYYFSPFLRIMIATHTLNRFGMAAWRHVISLFTYHEALDNKLVRLCMYEDLKPYDLGLAERLAAQGRNSREREERTRT